MALPRSTSRGIFLFLLSHIILLTIFVTRGTVGAGVIDTLQPGEWYEVPNSHLRDVAPCGGMPGNRCDSSKGDPPQVCFDSYGFYDFNHIIGGWNGGAFDTKKDRLIVWGGGHRGWAGNDVYVFSLDTLRWTRIKDASCLDGDPAPDMPIDSRAESTGYYHDDLPRARHTYNAIQYVPGLDRFCAFSGLGYSRDGNSYGNYVDCLNLTSLTWDKKGRTTDDPLGVGVVMFSAVDPVTGHVWLHGIHDNSNLVEFDPITFRGTVRGSGAGRYMYQWTGAIDPKRRKFVAVGGGSVYFWDIDSPGFITPKALTTAGATEIISSGNVGDGRPPGFVYDSISDKFVGWNGGSDVYTLNMDSLKWAKVSPAPTNKVIPTAANLNGTYGRFRYSPNKNVFVVVNSADENVYIYKLAPGGVTADTTPPTSPTGLTVK